MKQNSAIHLLTTSLTIGLGLLLLSVNSATAANQYFLTNGVVSGGTYSWDSSIWGAAANGPFTSAWGAGNFARFGRVANYTVTVGADESMAGLYQVAVNSALTITNSSSSGALDIVSGVQGFLTSGGSSTTIYTPIVGVGGIQPQFGAGSGSESLNLFGNNSYSGGTLFTSSSSLIGFNNNNSFGTGTMTVDMAANSFAPLISSGGSTIVLANNFVNSISGGGINFANSANTPVVLTGGISLGGNAINIRNNGDKTASLTIGGVISGTNSASVTFSGANGGPIIITNQSLYTGKTTLGQVGDTNFTLHLDVANAIQFSTNITLTGGTTLALDGFNQINQGTLYVSNGITTIDFGSLASVLSFSNSFAITWGGTLDFTNYIASDEIYFGANGLNTTQIDQIEFNGTDKGDGILEADGQLIDPNINPVPEPATIALGAIGGLGLLLIKRRKVSYPPQAKNGRDPFPPSGIGHSF